MGHYRSEMCCQTCGMMHGCDCYKQSEWYKNPKVRYYIGSFENGYPILNTKEHPFKNKYGVDLSGWVEKYDTAEEANLAREYRIKREIQKCEYTLEKLKVLNNGR